ncbi:MAG: serine hydrolase domain-containing protein [Gammaproteobacteria bacterium]
MQSLLHTAVRDGLPGVSLRVKGPGVDFQGAAGAADLLTREPLTAEHVLYVASLGKTFTAVLALQLWEEGRLALDEPITTWLPGDATTRIPSSETITLRHLLSHTSGVIDYMNDDTAWRADFVRSPHRRWNHSDVVPYLYDKPLLFRPGTAYHYSNSNYILVGHILERVSGQPFHALMRTRILAPLALKHTFNGRESSAGEKRAHGYIRRRGRVIDTYPWYSDYGLADSGMHSTPGDLVRFMEALFTSETLLSEAVRGQMTAVPESSPARSQYGLGIFIHRNPWGTGRWYTHDGIDPGYQADMIHVPDLGLTIALAANASLGRADDVYERLIMAAVRLALDAARLRRRADTLRDGGCRGWHPAGAAARLRRREAPVRLLSSGTGKQSQGARSRCR